MNDNALEVMIEGRNEKVTINVFDIIENPDSGKKYIIYSIGDQDTDDMYISILDEDDTSAVLKTIEDFNELKAVEEYILSPNYNVGDM